MGTLIATIGTVIVTGLLVASAARMARQADRDHATAEQHLRHVDALLDDLLINVAENGDHLVAPTTAVVREDPLSAALHARAHDRGFSSDFLFVNSKGDFEAYFALAAAQSGERPSAWANWANANLYDELLHFVDPEEFNEPIFVAKNRSSKSRQRLTPVQDLRGPAATPA